MDVLELHTSLSLGTAPSSKAGIVVQVVLPVAQPPSPSSSCLSFRLASIQDVRRAEPLEELPQVEGEEVVAVLLALVD